jgi:hypothetical protein
MTTQNLKQQITLKRILIVAYVLSVLLIAGLAKADESAPVTKVQADNEQQLVFIEGYRANPCQKVPRPEVVKIDRESRKVFMKVSPSFAHSRICAQVMQGKFNLVVTMASLKIPENVPYELTFDNAATDVQPVEVVNKGMVDAFPFSSTDLAGILIQESDGFSVQTRNQKFNVVPSMMNLEDYAGQIVDVSGHQVNFDLMPVEGTLISNPNDELSKSLIVTGISSSN